LEVVKFFNSGGSEVLSIAKPISSKQGDQILRKANALIRFHLKIDPDELTEEKFSEVWQGLRFALEFESKRHSLKEGETLKI
jgi:hypothetical protein